MLEGEVLPPARRTQYIQCPVHPALTYLDGGFCTECYADQTMDRVRLMDAAFADLVTGSVQKLKDVLALPVNPADIDQLKAVLSPLLRAVGMVERRFKRPEQINVQHKVKAVAIVGSPVDFREALKKQEEKPNA